MIKLLYGDCLEQMKSIADKSIDMICADPPYQMTQCKWDSLIPFDPLWAQIKRIRKPKAAIVLFGSEPFTSLLIYSNIKEFKEKLIWEKAIPTNFGNAKHKHMKYTEDIAVFYKKTSTFNPQYEERSKSGQERVKNKQKNPTQCHNTFDASSLTCFATNYEYKNPFNYSVDKKLHSNILRGHYLPSNAKERTPHPTQKPGSLIEHLIKVYTNENDLVLDFCMGSGTTGTACKKLKRNFIGIELDKYYFMVASKRLTN